MNRIKEIEALANNSDLSNVEFNKRATEALFYLLGYVNELQSFNTELIQLILKLQAVRDAAIGFESEPWCGEPNCQLRFDPRIKKMLQAMERLRP